MAITIYDKKSKNLVRRISGDVFGSGIFVGRSQVDNFNVFFPIKNINWIANGLTADEIKIIEGQK